jgi:hypothetical protein
MKLPKLDFSPLRYALVLVFSLVAILSTGVAAAQITGQGAVSGTVTDPDGASIPGAKIDVRSIATNVVLSRTSTSSGYYVVSPLSPGKYTVTVTAPGFSTLAQENVNVDALQTTAFDPKLKLGQITDTITVTTAPPALQTANATLGGTIENEVYSELPVAQSSGNPRDPTAFAALQPGVQAGGRAGVFDGTGAGNTNELYVEGVPLTTVDSQGDTRKLQENLSIEAVDQTQIQTTGSTAQFQGLGVENYSIKQGTNQFHGNAYIFFRNTVLDTWNFFSKSVTQPNAAGQQVRQPKPPENQNEISASLGGPIIHNKLFFFGNYDRYHFRSMANPTLATIPTVLMRTGNFTEFSAGQPTANPAIPPYHIYNPATYATCTAANGGVPCANQFSYQGVPDVIDPALISPISKKWAANLPGVTSTGLTNNYLSAREVGVDNWEFTGRLDYTINPKQQLAFISTNGSHVDVPYDYGAKSVLPYPYTNGTIVDELTTTDIIKHTYTFTPHVVNQFRYGYTRFWTTIGNKTVGDPMFSGTALGIGGLPAGLSSDTTPAASFSGGIDTPESFVAPTQYHEAVNTYTLADDLTWVKGRHNFTFGGDMQFLQFNQSIADSSSKPQSFTFSNTSTGGFSGGNLLSTSGAAYASFLVGAVSASSVYIQNFSTLGARYKAISPYVQDDWKVTSKLTLNLGLRWDLYTPFRENHDRWSFFNPNIQNPLTGNMGALSYIGHGAGTCNCDSPVNTWYKNFGPRVGFAWQVDRHDVVRGSFGIQYSHNGGVGGSNGGNYNGTGQTGLTVSSAFASSTQGEQPAFYLNPAFGNTSLPAYNSTITPTSTVNTGNYVGGGTASSLSYADPYLSGRAPYTESYTFGIQHLITNDLTLSADWVGNQSHFLYAQSRGYWEDQLAPQYQPLTFLLKQLPAGIDNAAGPNKGKTYLQEAQAIVPGIGLPYGNFGGAQGTIGQMLKPFPQYSSITDTWGDIGNANYNALQISLQQRKWHGLTYTLNYSFSKTIDDISGVRSGYPIPGNTIDGGVGSFQANRIDRSVSASNIPNNLHIYGAYDLPFGTQGHAGFTNHLTRALVGGWQTSFIFSKTSGAPLSIAGQGCQTPGSCYPSYNPAFGKASIRINGSYSSIHTVTQAASTKFLDSSGFASNPTNGPTPQNPTTALGTPVLGVPGNYGYNFGNTPREAPYHLYNIGTYNLDMSLKRTFPIYNRLKFSLQADCFNVTNHVQFGGLGTSLSSAAFGTVTSQNNSSRDWQLAGKFNF